MTLLARCFRRLLPCLLLLLTACQAQVPEGILSPEEMEAVLYDYHWAQALSSESKAEETTRHKDWKYNEHYYVKSALSKHGLTESDFDRSLEWYTRHADILFDIYQRLDERAAAESGSVTPTMGLHTADGDTTDLWSGPRQYLLSSSGLTHMNFEQSADTTLHAGDLLSWHFTTLWIYREGSKEATAQLSLLYANDSIVSKTINIYSTGPQALTVTIDSLPLKAVRGFVYQQVEWSEKPKLLLLNDVSLIRMRRKADSNKEDAAATSPDGEPAADTLRDIRLRPLTPEQRLRDSLHRSDSTRLHRPHFKDVSTP